MEAFLSAPTRANRVTQIKTKVRGVIRPKIAENALVCGLLTCFKRQGRVSDCSTCLIRTLLINFGVHRLDFLS